MSKDKKINQDKEFTEKTGQKNERGLRGEKPEDQKTPQHDPSEKQKSESQKDDLIKLLTKIGTLTAATGGVFAVFILIGLIITISFTSSMNFYGIPQFSEDFFKEAAISFFKYILNCMGDNIFCFFSFFIIIFFIFPLPKIIIYVAAQRMHSKKKGDRDHIVKLSIRIRIIHLIIVFTALIFVIWRILNDTFKQGDIQNNDLWFFILIPCLIGLGIFLAYCMNKLNKIDKWDKIICSVFLAFFILSLFIIPFVYGYKVFDLPVFQIRDIHFTQEDSDFFKEIKSIIRNSGDNLNKVFFFMGNTSRNIILLLTRSTGSGSKIEIVTIKTDLCPALQVVHEPDTNNSDIKTLRKFLRRYDEYKTTIEESSSVEGSILDGFELEENEKMEFADFIK